MDASTLVIVIALLAVEIYFKLMVSKKLTMHENLIGILLAERLNEIQKQRSILK